MISNSKKAVIHIAKMQTGMAEEEYRDLLSCVGVETSKDLTPPKFKIVMKHFEKLGFKRKKKSRKPIQSKVLLLGKITALCFAMDLKAGYAEGIAKRMFAVDKLQWCNADQLRKIVAALMYHKRRLKAEDEAI